jgi:hypothetical protein
LLVLPDHQRNGLEQQYAICYEPTLSEITAAEFAAATNISSDGAAPTTSDQSIVCYIKHRLNNSTAGSIGNNHRTTVHLQVSQFERGHCDEAMSPVGRDAFLTMDNLAASAGALDHRVRMYIPTI